MTPSHVLPSTGRDRLLDAGLRGRLGANNDWSQSAKHASERRPLSSSAISTRRKTSCAAFHWAVEHLQEELCFRGRLGGRSVVVLLLLASTASRAMTSTLTRGCR